MKDDKLKKIDQFEKKILNLVAFEGEVENILHHVVGKRLDECNKNDKYKIISYAVRSRLLDKWLDTEEKLRKNSPKKVYYLSLEFLIGRVLQNNSINIDVDEVSRTLMEIVGVEMEELFEEEPDAGLGNGGLGRLAACFLDSMATLKIPGRGFGIRYEYGMFNQAISDGRQIERPDKWLYNGYPWELKRLDKSVRVKFYGGIKYKNKDDGNFCVEWIDTKDIIAIPYDVLIPGYKNNNVNTLTLWSACSTDDFNLDYFNSGDYEKAVESKIEDENISKVLYPNDSYYLGRELRLKQQYFFVSASLQTIINDMRRNGNSILELPNYAAVQLNDTHPSIAVPELMRLLMDESKIDWDVAWDITVNTLAYTNHTLLPEALEKWDVELMGKVLPRHLQIIYEINKRFLDEVRDKYRDDEDIIKRMSIIEEGENKKIRMAYLAVIGSHSVNGVAKLHSELLKKRVLPDFYNFYPNKFNNKTNGITQRRWLKLCNPELSDLISSYIGENWITDLSKLRKLEDFTQDELFRKEWARIKFANKVKFADYCRKKLHIDITANTLFDCQFKRLHEYKRQLLNIFHVIHRYFELKKIVSSKVHDVSTGEETDEFKGIISRTVLIGGKAAPSYIAAKNIIKLINDVSFIINNDYETNQYLKVFFIPNYNVSIAEKVIPAADLSEQISTAGTEASGTGNMKFALNGALTVGTLDGANIEILEEVGEDNIFIFGLKSKEVFKLKENGYNSYEYYQSIPELKDVIDSITNGIFSPDEPDRHKGLIESLLSQDQYLVLADFLDYIRIQRIVDSEYRDRENWIKKSILNVANIGYFSSDRTIKEYAEDIWGIKLK